MHFVVEINVVLRQTGKKPKFKNKTITYMYIFNIYEIKFLKKAEVRNVFKYSRFFDSDECKN